jgi:hypothetical protein
VAGDDRERNLELAVMEMDVGAADFGIQSPKESSAGFQVRFADLGDGERSVRGRHHDGFGHF